MSEADNKKRSEWTLKALNRQKRKHIAAERQDRPAGVLEYLANKKEMQRQRDAALLVSKRLGNQTTVE